MRKHILNIEFHLIGHRDYMETIGICYVAIEFFFLLILECNEKHGDLFFCDCVCVCDSTPTRKKNANSSMRMRLQITTNRIIFIVATYYLF